MSADDAVTMSAANAVSLVCCMSGMTAAFKGTMKTIWKFKLTIEIYLRCLSGNFDEVNITIGRSKRSSLLLVSDRELLKKKKKVLFKFNNNGNHIYFVRIEINYKFSPRTRGLKKLKHRAPLTLV